MPDVGRNDPCPCGSGKKYKKCCLNKSFSQVGKEDSIRHALVQELLKLFRQRFHHEGFEDAVALFWDDFNPAEFLREDFLENAEINFWEWVVHDWADEVSGKSLVDLYLENKRAVSLDERRILTVLKNSVLSLYEVQEVFPGKGLLLKDLLRGGQYDVREKAATRHLAKWDILATRLLEVDGLHIMSGAGYPYPIRFKHDILQDVLSEYRRYSKKASDADMDSFLKANGEIFNFYWYDLIKNPPKFKLATTDREPMVISKAYYGFEDKASVVEALKRIEAFQEEENGFAWLGVRNKDGNAMLLGRVFFDRETLILECNSKERLKRGKELMQEHLPGIKHKADSYEDIYKHLESLKEKPVKQPPGDIPFEVQQEAYTKFMECHCRKWLTEKIPALGGKTPRQAVRSKNGREQVKELLKSFENAEEHNKKEGDPYYDLSWMWGELGLEREEGRSE
jgi:SEC-C motif